MRHPNQRLIPAFFFRGAFVIGAMVLTITLAYLARGRGYKTRLLHLGRPAPARAVYGRPQVQAAQPGDGETNILPETAIAVYLKLPNGGIDRHTLVPGAVRLVRTADGTPVPALLELSPGGHKISLRPQAPLAPDANYTFCVTESLKDVRGAAAIPWSIAFTTKPEQAPIDASIRFDSQRLANTIGAEYTALRVGPDHRLYAASSDGRIFRYPILADGTLGHPRVIESLRQACGEDRIIIGLCIDPASPPDAPALWVTHNQHAFENAAEWTGAVSRLSGPELGDVQHAVIHLPRSFRDHMTNQPAFGPDGALYFPQGSNTAFGAPDATWGGRPERQLSASILRLDVRRLTPGKPIDAMTADASGPFDPDCCDGPLTIYATGVRNAYSLVWHSNGHLYAPVNGSSPGGNTPAGNGLPGLSNLPFSEDDTLLDLLPGKYYGHPNPSQGHYVLHGGNPADPQAPCRIAQYPAGTRPDPDWQPPAYNFGKHASANGLIEYRGNAFNGRLDHKLLVCRFNVGSDILVLGVGPDGAITSAQHNIPGLRSLACPLDLAEDLQTGNLYISEYGGKRIMLARPVATGSESE